MSNATTPPPSQSFASVAALPEVTASNLKNKFSEVARLATREPLAVTRHNRRDFVILAAEQYEELQQSRLAPLKNLSADFDRMVAKMNTAKNRKARASFFKKSAVKPSPALSKLKKQRANAR